MSFAIVKGAPTMTQLALDRKLDAVVAETGRDEDRYCIGRLLFAALRDNPDLVNTIECTSGEQTSNAELLDKAVRTARALRSAGVRKGDVVIIMGVKHNLLAVPYYAALFIGAVSFHIDENATLLEIHHYVKLGEPKFIFTDANKVDITACAVRESGLESRVVSFGQQATPDYQDLATFIQHYTAHLESFRPEQMNKEDAVILSCSSGSTGSPKAVTITSYGIVSQLPMITVGDLCEKTVLPKKFIILSSCQWISYVLWSNLCAVFNIIKLQSSQPSTASHTIENLRKYRPDAVLLPPGIATDILQSPEFKMGDLSSIKWLLTGAAYVSVDLQVQLKKLVHPEGIVLMGSGCTECAGLYSLQTPDSTLESIGKEINILEYKIVDESDNEVPVGTTGELLVRGNAVFCKGYYKDEVSTRDLFTPDGWLRTGDLMYKDETGQYFYVDRKKLLIKQGSYHIYPLEVEGVICSVEGVAKAGVCWTESGLAALVETSPGATVTEQQVHHAVNSKLSYYKQLTGGVLFAPLPQTVSGKLDRPAMKTLLCTPQSNETDKLM